MKAIVMAGGRGTRLQPLTTSCPKPMVSFVNRTVLDHILNLLKSHHIFEVVITVQYLADQIQNHFGDGRHLGMSIQYAVEGAPLGTAGSVKNAQQYLNNETFLVISGDAITDIDLSQLLRFHREKQALATLALKQVQNPQEYGVVVTDDSGRVRKYLEKPCREQIISNTVNTGIYILEPEVLTMLEPNRVYDFSFDVFPLLLRQKALFGCLTDGYWRDMGTMQSYLRAVADAVDGKIGYISPEVIGEQKPMQNDHYLQDKGREQLMAVFLTNQKIYPVYWLVLSLLVLASDYAMGPFIQFPFLFIIPVMLASWYSGRWWGIGFAISLPLFRVYFSMFWVIPWTILDVGANVAIRMMVLLLIVFLVDRAAAQRRALANEVQVLRGLLPICSFCKKIRNEEKIWERLEEYITKRSAAQFSHGLCPECIKEHYQELFKA